MLKIYLIFQICRENHEKQYKEESATDFCLHLRTSLAVQWLSLHLKASTLKKKKDKTYLAEDLGSNLKTTDICYILT